MPGRPRSTTYCPSRAPQRCGNSAAQHLHCAGSDAGAGSCPHAAGPAHEQPLKQRCTAQERTTQLDTQLQAARKRYSAAEAQLKELHDTAQSAGSSDAAQAKKAETELAALRARLHAAEEQLKSQQTECGSTAASSLLDSSDWQALEAVMQPAGAKLAQQ